MRFFSAFSLSALVAALAACSASNPVLDQADAARLGALREAPASAGALVYEGAVFPLRATDSPQLFTYERRIHAVGNGFLASHITRDRKRDVVVVESAQFSSAYEVTRFDAIHREAGYSGSVVITGGRHLAYQLNQAGRTTTAIERVDDPVVTGPSLHGFILTHWDQLAAGKSVRVRMVVLSKMETYGFAIERAAEAGGVTAFSIKPTSPLVRLIVDPLRVEFDSTSRNVVRYVGRVPPLQRVDGKLSALDARVDYTMHTHAYQ